MARKPINPEGYTPQQKADSIDDENLVNLDSGNILGTPGGKGHRLTDMARKEEMEIGGTFIAEKTSEELALREIRPPSTRPQSIPDALPVVTDAFKKNAPVRSTVDSKIASIIEKNYQTIADATQKVFDDLAEGDKKTTEWFLKTFVTPDAMERMEKANKKILAEHIDFLQYRVFKRGHEFQQMMMVSKYTRNYIMAGRRSGKTEGLFLLTVHELVVPEHRVLIIGLTFETAMSLYWNSITRLLEDMEIPLSERKQSEGTLMTTNGSILKIVGNSSADEREKLRGGKWHKIIIDEAQSQKAIPYLVKTVCEPMLLDFKGQLYLAGTGPRVRKTFWEQIWQSDPGAMHLNWNLTQNPFIPDCEHVLAEIREDRHLAANDPLFLREYMGQIAYDDDALVLRLGEGNLVTDEDFQNWLRSTPRNDIRFAGGLDYGFTDSDAFVIICYAESRKEVWVVFQYKANREGIQSLARGIQQGLHFIKTGTLFQTLPLDVRTELNIFADTSDNRASVDLSTALGLNIYPAMKHDKQSGIDMLQDDCRTLNLKVWKDTPLIDEAMQTVFFRDENDNLTRELDDDTYHPDIIPSLVYACRSSAWMYRSR